LGPVVHDECVFLPVGERVQFIGQVIGVCIGETLECSETGARSVDIKYGEMITKPIVSIEDAIEANSFYEFARHEMHRSEDISVGEGDKIVTVNGSFRCGGQEHFYLETNSTLAIPNESATNLTVYASTQAVTKTQMYCASATNTPASKVVVRMKRMVGRVIFFLHALSLSISMINFNLFFDRAVGSEVKKPEVCLYLARRQLQQS
jgi:xanthine dehydrogenase/oxidase